MLIGEIVSDCREMMPAATAATLGNDSVTFAELDRQSNRVAHALGAQGIVFGSRVAWCTETSLLALAGFVAAARLGAIFVPLSPRESENTLAAQIELIEPDVVVVSGETGQALGSPSCVVITPGELRQTAERSSHHRTARPLALTPDDPHIMYLTSGSTGQPKGVLVSHRATYLRSCPGSGTFGGGIVGDGGLLSSFPLSHYGGWHYVVEAWLCRTAIHLVTRADDATLSSTLQARLPSACYAIPAVWERILAAARPGALGFLRHADTGTSRFDLSLLERIAVAAPNATTSVLYGASEAGPICRRNSWQEPTDAHSVGRAVTPGVVRISPEGEIQFRGPTVMNGYFRDAERTARAFAVEVDDDARWYRTGDLGRMDEFGFVTITGRLREVIRTGGETVAPGEVELAIRRHAAVADVAVFGLADERWGEVVAAAVVPRAGAVVPDLNELGEVLGDLPACKRPRRLFEVAEIPRTAATGQPKRSEIKAQLGSVPHSTSSCA